MITLEASTLAAALKHAASVTATHNSIPILANVLLRAEAGALEVITTDLDCELRQRLPVGKKDELAITVDARRLAAIAGAAQKGAQISLEMDGPRLLVKVGRCRFQLPTLPPADFPALPAQDLPAAVSLPGAELARALARVAPCRKRLERDGDYEQ